MNEEALTVRKATEEDTGALAALAAQLWPGHETEALADEFASLISRGDAACFLAWEGARATGFAQCQLRHDYVEGTGTSPVGYLEGIFVEAAFRRKGCGRRLLAACQAWAKERGCAEFASDCELENTESLRFHLRAGFTEANRIICFRKDL